MEGFQQDISF